MQTSNHRLRLISPALGMPPQSDAQVLGAVTWLLMQSRQHRELPLRMLGTLVLPAVKTGQYILLSERSAEASAEESGAETPVAWLAWANVSAQAEACYLSDHLEGLRADEWSSGDRMWCIHWIAPFSHTPILRRIVLDHVPNFCARALHHRGIERGMRVSTFRGKNISPQRARQWWRERPMLAAAPETPAAAQVADVSDTVSKPAPGGGAGL